MFTPEWVSITHWTLQELWHAMGPLKRNKKPDKYTTPRDFRVLRCMTSVTPNDRYGTVGTGLGAGTGAGTVQVRCRHDTWVRWVYGTWVRYMGTKTVPMYRTDLTRTMYPNSGKNSSRSAPISVGTWYGHGRYGTWHGFPYPHHPRTLAVPYPYTYPYRTHTVRVPYPYRTRTLTKSRTSRPVLV